MNLLKNLLTKEKTKTNKNFYVLPAPVTNTLLPEKSKLADIFTVFFAAHKKNLKKILKNAKQPKQQLFEIVNYTCKVFVLIYFETSLI